MVNMKKLLEITKNIFSRLHTKVSSSILINFSRLASKIIHKRLYSVFLNSLFCIFCFIDDQTMTTYFRSVSGIKCVCHVGWKPFSYVKSWQLLTKIDDFGGWCMLRRHAKLYTPNTLNKDLIFWHSQKIVAAVKY